LEVDGVGHVARASGGIEDQRHDRFIRGQRSEFDRSACGHALELGLNVAGRRGQRIVDALQVARSQLSA